MKAIAFGLAAALAAGSVLMAPTPSHAQYVTGIPGPDPAYDDEFGWGPAYQPESDRYQPGTPLTPGQRAAYDYYRRTGRTVYAPAPPPAGYYEAMPGAARGAPIVERRVVYRTRAAASPRRVVRTKVVRGSARAERRVVRSAYR